MFGADFQTSDDIIQPLESQGIPRMYSKDEQYDHIVEMKKLNHSILLNYLELLDLMIESPGSAERQGKIEEIKVLFINLHHLVNEFRPHQARETLRVMLHRQKQQRMETADKLQKHIDKARVLLRNCGTLLSAMSTSSQTSVKTADTESKVEVIISPPEESNNPELKKLEAMCAIVDAL